MHQDIHLTPATSNSHGAGVNWDTFVAGKRQCLALDILGEINLIQAKDNPATMFLINTSNDSFS